MSNDIYDPLDEYVNTFRPKFERVARETFAELAKEAQVDVEANHETCSRLYDTEDELEDVNNKYWWARFFCFLLWGGVIAGAIYLYKNQNSLDTTTVYLIFMVMVVAVLCLLFKIHPLMSSLSDENDDLKQQAHDIEMEGWQQMEPLNRLYDWDMLPRMITTIGAPDKEYCDAMTMSGSKVEGWEVTGSGIERVVVGLRVAHAEGNPRHRSYRHGRQWHWFGA